MSGFRKRLLTDVSGLLNVELVGYMEKVRVDEPLHGGDGALSTSGGVKVEINPAHAALVTDVVLEGASNFTLAQKGPIDHFVKHAAFHRHYSSSKFIITKRQTPPTHYISYISTT